MTVDELLARRVDTCVECMWWRFVLDGCTVGEREDVSRSFAEHVLDYHINRAALYWLGWPMALPMGGGKVGLN